MQMQSPRSVTGGSRLDGVVEATSKPDLTNLKEELPNPYKSMVDDPVTNNEYRT